MKKILFLLFLGVKLFAFQVGEELTFDLNYGIINAGQSTIKVSETVYRDSIKCLQIVSESRTNNFFDKIFKVRDKIESIWDFESFSYKFSKNLSEGKYRQQRTHFYYPAQKFSLYLKKDKKATKFTETKIFIPGKTHDMLSGFYWMRLQKLTVGDTIFTNVTVDGKNYNAGIKILRKEKIQSIFGQTECLVLEPILKSDSIFKQSGKMLIWITNDDNKIPLKIESKIIFGHFRATLKEAKNAFN